MIIARAQLGAAGASDTAALAFGGFYAGAENYTEGYDGTSWATLSPLNTQRNLLGGVGTNAAALAFGGNPTGACTEAYN
jgi:hypothetical protein